MPSAHPQVPRRAFALAAALLVLAVLFVYGRTVLGGFTWVYDDARFILHNPELYKARGPSAFVWDFMTDMRTTDPMSPTGIVRPFRTMLFSLTARGFGLDPSAFHGVSIAVFAASSVALLRLLTTLVGDLRAAFLGALLWTLHPMQTEVVAWVSSLGDLGMAACAFLALDFALRPGWRAFALSLVATAAALLFKETAVALPLLVIAVQAFAANRRRERFTIAAVLLRTWPYWLIVLGYWFKYRAVVQIGGTSHVNTFVMGGSVQGTLATMSRAFAFVYPLESLLPVRPALDWFLPSVTGFGSPAAILATMLLAAGAWVVASGLLRGRIWSVALVLFFAPLLPVANFPFSLGIPTTERFLHLPLLALALLVAHALRDASRAAVLATAVIATSFAVISFQRCEVWRDDDRLFGATAAQHESPRAEGYLAAELRKAGFAKRIAAQNGSAVEREAANAEARRLLEASLAHSERSIAMWDRAESTTASRSHVIVVPRVNAANAAYLLGRAHESLMHSKIAITVGSDLFPQAYYNAAIAWLDVGRGACAAEAAIKAYELGQGESSGEKQEIAEILRRAASLSATDRETELTYQILERAAAIAPDPRAARSDLSLYRARSGEEVATLRTVAQQSGEPRDLAALAVALASVGGESLAEAEQIRAKLDAEHRFPVDAETRWIHARFEARGDMANRAGHMSAAIRAYDAAAELARTETRTADWIEASYRGALAREAASAWNLDLAARFRAVAEAYARGTPAPGGAVTQSTTDAARRYAEQAAKRIEAVAPWFPEPANGEKSER